MVSNERLGQLVRLEETLEEFEVRGVATAVEEDSDAKGDREASFCDGNKTRVSLLFVSSWTEAIYILTEVVTTMILQRKTKQQEQKLPQTTLGASDTDTGCSSACLNKHKSGPA